MLDDFIAENDSIQTRRAVIWAPDQEDDALLVDGFRFRTSNRFLHVDSEDDLITSSLTLEDCHFGYEWNDANEDDEIDGYEIDETLGEHAIYILGQCELTMTRCVARYINGGNSKTLLHAQITGGSDETGWLNHTVSDCEFDRNIVKTVLYADRSSISSDDTTFTANECTGNVINAAFGINLFECQFIENTGGNGEGQHTVRWGVYNGSATQANIENCLFEDNDANRGSILCDGAGTHSIRIANCSFLRNNWSGIEAKSGDVEITDCRFESLALNSNSNAIAGAISIGQANTTIQRCDFINNAARQGGGIYLSHAAPSSTIEDCWFEGNTADEGHAIYRQHGNSTHTITGCTVTGHGEGAAFVTTGDASSAGTRNVTNSVFCNNVQDFDDEALWTITDCQQKVDCGDISYDAATSEELTEALENAVDGSTISITEGGSYDIGSLDIISANGLAITNTSGELVTLTGGIEIDPGGSYEGGLAGGSLAIVFEGITIEGSGSSEGLPAYGGGILVRSGDVMLINCTLRNLEATGAGGALYVGTFCSVTLFDCVLENNTAPIGGAAYVEDGGYISLIGTTLCGNGVELEEQIYGAYDIDEESCIVADCTDNDGDGTPDGCGAPPCPADIDGSGSVDGADLSMLLGAWGVCTDPGDCPADIDGDGAVTGADLSMLLGAWGACPE